MTDASGQPPCYHLRNAYATKSAAFSGISQRKIAQPLSLFVSSMGSHSHHTLHNSNTRRGVDFSKDVRLIAVHNSKRYGAAFHCLFIYIYVYRYLSLAKLEQQKEQREKSIAGLQISTIT